MPELESIAGSPAASDEPILLRPHSRAWGLIIALLIFALAGAGVAVLLLDGRHIAAGLLVAALCLLTGLLPIAYFLRARVVLRDRTITKFGLARRVGSCRAQLIDSIEPYVTRWAGSRWDDPDWHLESHGYAFRLVDGTPIFKLSRIWWPELGIELLGRRIGLEGALAAQSSPRMWRPVDSTTDQTPTQPPEAAGVRPITVIVVVLVVAGLALALFWPLVSGKPYP